MTDPSARADTDEYVPAMEPPSVKRIRTTPKRFVAILVIAFVSPVVAAQIIILFAAILEEATGIYGVVGVALFTLWLGVPIGWVVIPFVALSLEARRAQTVKYYLVSVLPAMASLIFPPAMIVALPFALLTAAFVVLQIKYVFRLRKAPPS